MSQGLYIRAISGLYTTSPLLISTEHNQMKGVNGADVMVRRSIDVHIVGELNFINSWLKEREGMRPRTNLLCIFPYRLEKQIIPFWKRKFGP